METYMGRHLGCNHAFSLMELIVGLGVVAVMSSILVPVFNKVKAQAKQTSCLSNERQIGYALLQYSDDNDEHLPCGISGMPYQGIGWAGSIYPYTKNGNIYHCPSDPAMSLKNSVAVSYALNGLVVPAGINAVTMPSRTILLSEVAPQDNVWVNVEDVNEAWSSSHSSIDISDAIITATGDGSWTCCDGVQYKYATGYIREYPNGRPFNQDMANSRHLKGANYLYVDAHVAYVNPKQVRSRFVSVNDLEGEAFYSVY